MINYRFIARSLGLLILLEAVLMSSCWLVGRCYGETHWATWGIPIGLASVLGVLLLLLSRNSQSKFGRRDGYLVVATVWIIFSLIGMLPFLVGGHTDRVALAFFETMSGFTTTGCTAFSDLESLPHSILFWRSLTHWIGGMGIIFFTLAFLPALGIGEQELFSAESTGLSSTRLHPRISTTAHWLWSLYFLITLCCTLTYWGCGMNFFDAINHAFATIATGGFSTHTASVAYFHSPAIEYAMSFFMLLASINFTLLFLFVIKHKYHQILKDEELRLFVFILCGTIAIITLSRWLETDQLSEASFRSTLFHTISLISTTGFTTENFMHWPHISWISLSIVGVIGACSGSTSGGIKMVRILTGFKLVDNEFRRILHPRAVIPTRLNNNFLGTHVTQSVFAYTFFYILFIVTASAAMTMLHIPMLDAVSLSLSAFSNVGPTIGHMVGPLDEWGKLPDAALWINALLMIAGRLEIFTLLLPFYPRFWKNN